MSKQTINTYHFKSPVGNLYLYADDTSLLGLTFAEHTETLAEQFKEVEFIEKESPVIKKTVRQLAEYFAGKRKSFELDLAPSGTAFQKKAWATLRKIPFGTTLSYKEQSTKMGSPKAVRAVGSANGQNPIAIIVPCHRVISSSGKISGYAGGPKIKAKLLRLEGLNPIA